MRLDYRLALALMVAAGIGGSFAAHALALFAIPDDASGFHEYYLRGLAQPIPVVQFAANWSVLAVVWLTFFVISWLGGRLSADAAKRSSRPELVVLICFAIAGIALTTFSIMQAYDVYYYTAYGRLYGLHGANPYSYGSPYTFDDPTLTQNLIPTHNPPFPDPYGPGFTLFAGLVARLAGSAPLAAQLWSWRLIGLLSALTIAFGLLRLIRDKSASERARSVGAFAFHPLILYEACVGGHNDLLMIAPAVWAWVLADEMPLIAALLLGVSISMKYIALLLAPFIIIRAASKSRVAPVLVAAIALIIPWLCFQPFAMGSPAVKSLEAVGSSLLMSFTWLLVLPWLHGPWAQTPLIPDLSLPLIGAITIPRVIQLLVIFAALCVIGVSVVRFARLRACGDVWRSITALIWAMPALHPWYLTWLSPALVNGPWGTYAWWFGSFALLTYANQGVVPTPLNRALFVAIAVAVFAVPVLAARYRVRVPPAQASGQPQV